MLYNGNNSHFYCILKDFYILITNYESIIELFVYMVILFL